MPVNPEYNAIVKIITSAAESLGAKVHMEEEWSFVGRISYSSGISRYFRLSTLDINTMGASEIARDKAYARYFLADRGYPVAEGKTFFRDEWAAKIKVQNRGVHDAWIYANEIGLPVYIKPNSLSRGVGVAKVTSVNEFNTAAKIALKEDKVIIVEKEFVGRDYRIVVLDGEVISAYERIALHVIGDGKSTLGELVTAKEEYFRSVNRDITVNLEDARAVMNMSRVNLDCNSVIRKGRTFKIFDNANLSTGGESVDVTDIVGIGFKRIASEIAFDMGLRLVGVDLIIDGDISREPVDGRYCVLEINSAPGLDHYASMGEKQKQTVLGLYRRVIRSMERGHESVRPNRYSSVQDDKMADGQ